jgi:hypothetical protein
MDMNCYEDIIRPISPDAPGWGDSRKADATVQKLCAKSVKYHLSILRMALSQAM